MDVAVWLAEAVIEDDDENLTEAEIDELFEATQPIGNAINALAQAEVVLAEAAATARAEGSPMDDNDTPPPDWAGTPLRRIWPALTADERAEILTSRDDTALARLAADLRRTDSAESLGARPGGMFALDSDPSMKWHAERFEEPWNGWAAPVVAPEDATRPLAKRHYVTPRPTLNQAIKSIKEELQQRLQEKTSNETLFSVRWQVT